MTSIDQLKQFETLFLLDENGEKLVVSSPIFDNGDGSFSFETTNPKTQESYRVTARISEQ